MGKINTTNVNQFNVSCPCCRETIYSSGTGDGSWLNDGDLIDDSLLSKHFTDDQLSTASLFFYWQGACPQCSTRYYVVEVSLLPVDACHDMNSDTNQVLLGNSLSDSELETYYLCGVNKNIELEYLSNRDWLMIESSTHYGKRQQHFFGCFPTTIDMDDILEEVSLLYSDLVTMNRGGNSL
jgi:hypothetical protein